MASAAEELLPSAVVRRFSTASIKAHTRAADVLEQRSRPQLKKSKSWADGLVAPPPVPKLAIPTSRPATGGRVRAQQEAAIVHSDEPTGDSSPKAQEAKKGILPSWMRHLVDKANRIMRPAAKEYFRDTTDYTKRLGLDRSEVEGLMMSSQQARRNSLTPGQRLPRSRTQASLESQELSPGFRPPRAALEVRRESHAMGMTSGRRTSSTPAPRITRSRTVASLAALDTQEFQKDARRVRRNRDG
mmetsp:Transcript_24555/g.46357  ORF Transcript_24555/g.46357 Transcript_24555/m.46357 type:complete len:244 (+) Transcript_24555:129-860(+)